MASALRPVMRYTLAIAVGVCLLAAGALVGVSAQQARTVSDTPTSIDDVLVAVRSDLQSTRTDVIAKNLTLTPAQAAKFWPLFETYQKAQNAIMDEQLRGIQRYIEDFDTLDDGAALGLITAHFDRDAKMNELRRKWLPQFRSALGTKLAVRVMQIDRRLSLAHQVQFAAKIPLAH
jgi:Spy/CpxP family protein refolding chaperone